MKLGSGFLARRATALIAVAIVATPILGGGATHADELKLKDGTKITGTIVGFDDNSFKVKTNYGFAEVQKDQVVSITITPAPKAGDSEQKSEAASKSDSSAKPSTSAKEPKSENSTAAGSTASPASTSAAPTSAPTGSAKTLVPSNTGAPLSATVAAAPSTGATAPPAQPAIGNSVPPKPATPQPIRESVDGNIYTNETYGFQMYKPPDWQVIASAGTLLPGAIAAMGTDDQTTYLLIGPGPAGKNLGADEDAADRRLRDIMDNFRPLEIQHVTVSGVDAIERRFRGSVDQQDWSGVVVLIPHGAQLFTVFGMTLADTDLVQIQENVIARTISSLQFANQ